MDTSLLLKPCLSEAFFNSLYLGARIKKKIIQQKKCLAFHSPLTYDINDDYKIQRKVKGTRIRNPRTTRISAIEKRTGIKMPRNRVKSKGVSFTILSCFFNNKKIYISIFYLKFHVDLISNIG